MVVLLWCGGVDASSDLYSWETSKMLLTKIQVFFYLFKYFIVQANLGQAVPVKSLMQDKFDSNQKIWLLFPLLYSLNPCNSCTPSYLTRGRVKVHIHVCFFPEDSVTVDVFFRTVNMFFYATSTFFLWRVCTHLFWFLVVRPNIKTNLEKINQSGSSSIQNRNKSSSPPQLKIKTNVHTLRKKKPFHS